MLLLPSSFLLSSSFLTVITNAPTPSPPTHTLFTHTHPPHTHTHTQVLKSTPPYTSSHLTCQEQSLLLARQQVIDLSDHRQKMKKESDHVNEVWTLCCCVVCCAVRCGVLWCAVLYCTVLYCTVLYVLYCTVLYCTVCPVLYVLYCTAISYASLHHSIVININNRPY
jgi:hypothetical protein